MHKDFKIIINNFIKNIKSIIHKNPKKVKIIFFALIIIILIAILISIYLKEKDKQKYVEYNGKNLSESKYPGYKELIDNLLASHPNWTFTILFTGLDWDTVIRNETTASHGRNLVQGKSGESVVCGRTSIECCP